MKLIARNRESGRNARGAALPAQHVELADVNAGIELPRAKG
jgi:hypothetical protein